MLSSTVIGFLAGISAATWVYTQTMRKTGGDNKSSLITGGLAGLGAFVVIVTIVVTIDQMMK